MDNTLDQKVDQLLDFIMKKCLWQFHSRSWDRVRQNDNILLKTEQLLCGEPVSTDTPSDKCYWVDAVYLVDNFKQRYPWIADMRKDDIKIIMQSLKERLDYQTINGSLNAELSEPRY